VIPRQPTVASDGGPWAEHDMACAVCRKRNAVLILETGYFQPCWGCQTAGFYLVRPPVGWRWLACRWRPKR
jgi:hypothetical protein